MSCGVVNPKFSDANLGSLIGGSSNSGVNNYGYYGSDGSKQVNSVGSSYGSTFGDGDILGIALDLTNNYLYFSKNGTWQNSGVPTSGSSGTGGISITNDFYTFANCSHNNSATGTTYIYANFGNPPYSANSYTDGAGYGNFSYAVPSGYYSLNTKNLATFG
jgi:hypothetical protein